MKPADGHWTYLSVYLSVWWIAQYRNLVYNLFSYCWLIAVCLISVDSDNRVSPVTVSLIRNLLIVDPKSRLTAGQVLDQLRSVILTWSVSTFTALYIRLMSQSLRLKIASCWLQWSSVKYANYSSQIMSLIVTITFSKFIFLIQLFL